MIRRFVEAKVSFAGIHHWPAATNYLRHPHRHVFVVRARKEVTDLDREVEFFQLSEEIKDVIRDLFLLREDGIRDLGDTSCEKLANILLNTLSLSSCWVYEDGDSGGGVELVSDG